VDAGLSLSEKRFLYHKGHKVHKEEQRQVRKMKDRKMAFDITAMLTVEQHSGCLPKAFKGWSFKKLGL